MQIDAIAGQAPLLINQASIIYLYNCSQLKAKQQSRRCNYTRKCSQVNLCFNSSAMECAQIQKLIL